MRTRMAIGLVISVSSLIMTDCATPTTKSLRPALTALAIERVSIEPKTIDVRKQDLVTIRFDLTHPATVRIDLVDEEGRVVRQLDGGERAPGFQTMSWDGRDTEGHPVPRGVYRYVIRAQEGQGAQVIYDPSSETGGEELEPRDFAYDRQTGRLSWVMPKAGYARLRIGIEGFPHLRTLLDWEPLEGGAQALIWDGLDSSGLINLKEHPDLSLKLKVFAMPNNTVIVHGEPPAPPSNLASTYPPITKASIAAFHARHPRATCREVGVRLEFPGVTQHDPQGRPVLVGIAPIQVAIDEHDASRLVNERFELALFEDLTVIVEEEKGTTPFTYLLDTTMLPPGPHLLTVNVLGGNDHYGVETRQVIIGAHP